MRHVVMSDTGEGNIFDKMFAEINASLGTSMEEILSQIDCGLDTTDLSENPLADGVSYTGAFDVANNPMSNDASKASGDFDSMPGPIGMGGLGGAGPGADESDAGIIDAGIANHGLANTGFTNPGIADSAHNVHNVPGFPGLSAPEATPGGSILTVGGTSNEGASEAAKLSYKMWVCIMNNDLRGVAALLREGANPMMNLKYGGYALDMAIRMSRLGILVLFYRTSKSFADHGIRALLTAVAEDKKEVVQAVLKMGMGGRLMNDETLKLIFHGFACRHGTFEMLDFLDINGTWFSWKSYGRWCISLTHKTEAWANAAKIRELRARYMLVCSLLDYPGTRIWFDTNE